MSLCRKLCHIKLKLNQCSSPQFARITTDFYVTVFTKISIGKNNVNIDQQIFSIWTTECSLKFYNSSADVHSKRLPHLSLLIVRSGRDGREVTSDLFVFCRLHVPLKSSWECHCDPVLLLGSGSTQRPTVYWPFLLPLDFVVVQLGDFSLFKWYKSIQVFFLHSGA